MISKIRSGWARSLLVGVLVTALLLIADGVYAGLRFKATFTSAACGLKQASDALEDLDVVAAERSLQLALADIAKASDLLRHPALRVTGTIPALRDNISALESLTEAAEGAARSGLTGTEAATGLGLAKGSGLGTLYRDGRVDLNALDRASEAIERATSLLTSASETLREAPRAGFHSIRRSQAAAKSLLNEALGSLQDSTTVLNQLPSLLGQTASRRYFLAFQAPSEARGGGGLIGVYGILAAHEGRLRLTKVAPIRELVKKLKGKVQGPTWYESLYGGVDGLGGWREANSSPTFPVVARILLQMYERSTGESLNGVMAMDPIVVTELLRGVGAIEVPGFPESVTAANAPRILMRDIYLRFVGQEDRQNDFLRALVDQVWIRLGNGAVDTEELRGALARSVESQRLKFYATDRSERAAIAVLGLDGDPRTEGPNVQMLFHNNFAANKIDWFLHRSQSTSIAIDEEGTGHVVARMTLKNEAPRGRKSLLKKSDVNELPAGLNLMSMHFMLPQGASIAEMYFGSTPTDHFSGLEAGVFPEAWAPLQLPVQDSVEVSVSYEVPDMVSFHDGRATFAMTFLPQALVRPDGFDLRVVAPKGFRIGSMRHDASFGESLNVSGSLAKPRRVKARLLAPGVAPPTKGQRLASICAKP